MGHEPKLSQGERKLKREMAEAFRAGGFSPPEPSEWSTRSGPRSSTVPELLTLLVDEEQIVEVGPGLYLDQEAEAEMRRRVQGTARRRRRDHDGGASRPAGDHRGSSPCRSASISTGSAWTRREGDVRTLGDRAPRARAGRGRDPPVSDPSRRRLPPVHAVLDSPGLADSLATRGREATLRAVRATLESARETLAKGEETAVDVDSLAKRAEASLAGERPWLRPVINATGILLNTGLGRAPLAAEAAEAVDRVVRGYCNLEFDLDRGERGRRTDGVEALLTQLTGAEAAAVVNNNAAATILAVRALAQGKEVIVSRGQLVEIGGSFRLPEIIEVSGARLVEVGTTNKTRLADYVRAIGPETAALLRVHPSNYRVVGFTEEVAIADLARLGRERDLWTIDDIGSGALAPGLPPHVRGEPTALEGLEAGADLVLFSGDKLLGGPQCGLLIGSREAIEPVRRDPLMRALRVDKMTLAALEATLRLALDPARAGLKIPLWAFLNVSLESLRERANRLRETFCQEMKLDASVLESSAFLGGGSVPLEPIPTAVVRVGPPIPRVLALRSGLGQATPDRKPLSIVTRVQGGAVLFDLRAVAEADDGAIAEAVRCSMATSPALIDYHGGNSLFPFRPRSGMVRPVIPTDRVRYPPDKRAKKRCPSILRQAVIPRERRSRSASTSARPTKP